ncbi:hypothetical protein JVX98_28245 [Ensifer sp. PDNC004]|uniref:hypothetical protein n=1 Tax=Ensifer sp. PDNC004 TaxID=2811423 RepID=UPI00196686F7|nr:hypothetical protein [Ensifer sp. PDNC004]QRY68182.1 hypothetical protein JVX98_28245 [Ensifer sp. PDNC004]
MSGPRFSVIPSGAVLDRRLMRGDLDVLCLLGISADTDTGWCRRSQVKMAKQLEVARSTVQASINRLVDAGWVERRMLKVPGEAGQRDSAHEYRVVLDVRDRDEVSPSAPCRPVGTPADTPAPPADPDRHLINVSSINDTNPHSVRIGSPPPQGSVLAELMTVLDRDHAQAVIDHRIAMRRRLTPHAAKLLARRFALMPNPNAAADAMIGNGWQGFEPEWLENRKGGRAPPRLPDKPPSPAQKLRNAIQIAKETGDETGNRRTDQPLDGGLRLIGGDRE